MAARIRQDLPRVFALPGETEADDVYRALRDAAGEVEIAEMHARAFSSQDLFGDPEAPVVSLENIAAMAAIAAELKFRLTTFTDAAESIDQAVLDLVELRRAQQEVSK